MTKFFRHFLFVFNHITNWANKFDYLYNDCSHLRWQKSNFLRKFNIDIGRLSKQIMIDVRSTSSIYRKKNANGLNYWISFIIIFLSFLKKQKRNPFFFFFLREKTRSLLVNVFRTRRSNVALGSTEVLKRNFYFSLRFSFSYSFDFWK